MTEYQIFTILPQISHFHKYRNFFKYVCNFLDQLLHPYKFYGRDMSGILFFIFASCHPLRLIGSSMFGATFNLLPVPDYHNFWALGQDIGWFLQGLYAQVREKNHSGPGSLGAYGLGLWSSVLARLRKSSSCKMMDT